MCTGHHHIMGACCMGKGSHCGLGSQDDYLNSLLSMSAYIPTVHHWASPWSPTLFGPDSSVQDLLPSHARIPDQPPRTSL